MVADEAASKLAEALQQANTKTTRGTHIMLRPIACLLALAILAGCQPPADTSATPRDGGTAASGRKYRIAVIPKGTSHEFWKSVHYGAEQAGKEFDAEILWQGPLQESDRDGQISVMQNFTTKQVDGICLAPLDSQALIASVREAKGAGIPVVIFDSGLDDESLIVSYVATDNYHGGEMAGDAMAARLNGQGNVMLLRYTPGSQSTTLREEGFLDAIKKHPDIKVLSSDQYAGTTPESSVDKAQQMLNKFGDQVDGIFAVCEPNANGTLQALEERGLAGKVIFIGFDPNQRMVKALHDKNMHGIVLQDPVRMGYLAVKTMVEHLKGEMVEPRIATGEVIATPENANEPRTQELLNPKQFGE